MKVKFISPVNAGTKVYSVGDTADLPSLQAGELIACGAAEQLDPGAAKAAAKAEAAAREAAEKLAGEQEAEQALAVAEKSALEAWDNDAALREQHGNDFPTYMASLSKAD